MSKLLVTSIVFATGLLPVLAAREPDPVRSLRRVLGYGLAFAAFYVFALLVIYPRV